MHPKTNQLRAVIDGELPAQHAAQVQLHISSCLSCQRRLEDLQTRSHQVAGHLDSISPRSDEEHRSPSLAFTQIFNSARKNNPRKEIFKTMFNRKPIWTAIAVIAVIAIALSLTPVRAWASDFLNLFRLEKVTVIQFDPQAVNQANEQLGNLQKTANNILEKNVKVTEGGEIRGVSSVDEATAAAGFTPRIPTGMEDVKLAFQPGMKVTFTIDQVPLQAIIDALEVDVQLPEEVDGKEITAITRPGVIAASGCDPAQANSQIPHECTVLIQIPSPTVDAPDGLDMPKIGAAVLQLLGLTPDEAEQLSQRIDWTSTLLLPIPKDGNIQVSDLTVDGVTGTLLIQENENSYTLLWLKDGIFYIMRGPGWATEAQTLAGTLP